MGAVAAPAGIRAGLVDLQRVLVDALEENAVLWDDGWLAVLKSAESTDIVVAVAVLLFACVEHVVPVQVGPVAYFAYDWALLPQIFANVSPVDLELVAAFVAFYIYFVVIDSQIDEHLLLFDLNSLKFYFEVLDAIVGL